MKTMNFVAPLLLSICAVGSITLASTASNKATKQTLGVNSDSAVKPSRQAKLGTSFKMDGTALRGKYQSSLGTRATVENDKSLDDLLTGRTQFDDRIQQDSEKN